MEKYKTIHENAINLNKINSFPTLLNNTHESVYKSYQILEAVKTMLKRGDSKETILETILFLEEKKEIGSYTVTENKSSAVFTRNGINDDLV